MSAKITNKMSLLRETLRLNTGFEIPRIGFGTYQIRGNSCFTSVQTALSCGYIHIDTAQMYNNEPQIAKALLGYDRSSIFITSKVGPNQQGYENAREACFNSLSNLGVDYLDLMLIHWPGVSSLSLSDPGIVNIRHDTWRALEDLQAEGKIRSIGVSNFMRIHLEKLISTCRVMPSVNQIEYHPLCHDDELVNFCQEKGIVVEAYSSLARADQSLWKSLNIQHISQKHSKNVAQVLLRWGYQKNVVILPKSATVERIRSNIDIDFVLDEEDMKSIDAMHREERVCWDPNRVII